KSGIIPTSCCLSDVVKPDDEYPHASGGFADVWRGTHDGVPVALKFIRLHTGNREGFRKVRTHQSSADQEVVIWRRLLHCNIVPFLGVVDRRRPCIVSEWMEYEDVMSYLKRFPQANRTQLITDIARGLKYMHDSEVVHGDMKPVSR
ncbi:kinase-like protein, partial [Punctularia strigosozonata HHB-11173 SS5]|uniref:kinase-like protein n=1 Tax=Punctularia strigosozonata (strain HHB-11173) TaxID=741275 RepID=UPI0004416BC7